VASHIIHSRVFFGQPRVRKILELRTCPFVISWVGRGDFSLGLLSLPSVLGQLLSSLVLLISRTDFVVESGKQIIQHMVLTQLKFHCKQLIIFFLTKILYSVTQGCIPKKGTPVATHSGVRGWGIVTHSQYVQSFG